METEQVANTSTIKFETPITVPYIFGEQKPISFGLYQTDTTEPQPFCKVETTIDEIMLANSLTWKDKELRTRTGNYCGDLTVTAEVEPFPT